MIKIFKKIFLFTILIVNLLRKLTVGLTLFLYNRAIGSRWGVIMFLAVVGLLMLLSSVFLMPQDSVANEVKESGEVAIQSNLNVEEIHQHENIIKKVSDSSEQIENIIADSRDPMTPDHLGQPLNSTDAISFQLTEFAGSGTTGREEPFSIRIFGGSDIDSGPDDLIKENLSPAELAKLEAERRRNEVTDALNNDVSLKGIVVDLDNEKSDPVTILSVVDPDGSVSIKNFKSGDEVNLPLCQATVSKIHDHMVVLTSEGVTVEKYLPAFEDDEVIETSDTSSSETGDLMPPPTPGSGDSTSINDAKQKIEEIDKLLDSF